MSLYSMELFYVAIKEEQYAHVGFLRKPRGIQGGIMAVWSYPLSDKVLLQLAALFVEIDYVKVPYMIQRITPLTEMKAIVELQGIPSKTEAYLLRNLPLFLPLSIQLNRMPSSIFARLGNYIVMDRLLGPLGSIQTIYCVKDRPILVVDYEGKELLIPYYKPFLIGVNDQQQKVMVTLPEGYLTAML